MISTLQELKDILNAQDQKIESNNTGTLSHSGVRRGKADLKTRDLVSKLNTEQLQALEAYVIENFNYRYAGIAKTSKRLSAVSAKWHDFIRLLDNDTLRQQFNRIRAEYDRYETQKKHLRTQFKSSEVISFCLFDAIQPKLTKTATATATIENEGMTIPASPVAPSIEDESQTMNLRNAAKDVIDNVKNLVTDSQMKPAPVLAQAAPAVAAVSNQGMTIPASPVAPSIENQSQTMGLRNAAKDVIDNVKNLVTDSQMKPAPVLTQAAPAVAAVSNQGMAIPASPVAPSIEDQSQTMNLRNAAKDVIDNVKNLVADSQMKPAPVLAQAAPAVATVSNQGMTIPASSVAPSIEKKAQTSALRKAANYVIAMIKNLVADSQVKPKSVLAQAEPVTAQVKNEGMTTSASSVTPSIENKPQTVELRKAAKQVANDVKNLVVDSQVKPTPRPVAQKNIDAEAKIAQEKSDHDFALRLQREIEREETARQKTHDTDHLLAIKMQIEEEVKEPIIFPKPKDLDLPTAEKVAGDIYKRGMQQYRPQSQRQKAKEVVDGYVLGIYVETRSLTMTVSATGFFIHEVSHAMYLEMDVKRNNLHVNTSLFAYASSYYHQNNLFAKSAASQLETALEIARPSKPRA